MCSHFFCTFINQNVLELFKVYALQNGQERFMKICHLRKRGAVENLFFPKKGVNKSENPAYLVYGWSPLSGPSGLGIWYSPNYPCFPQGRHKLLFQASKSWQKVSSLSPPYYSLLASSGSKTIV